MFFANFVRFSQNNEIMRIMMLCIIFVIFAKMGPFFRGGIPRGNLTKIAQNVKTGYKVHTYTMHHILSLGKKLVPTVEATVHLRKDSKHLPTCIYI